MSTEPPPPPPRPQHTRTRELAAQAAAILRSGWGRAAVAAVAVIPILYVLNLLLAWLQSEVTPLLVELGGEAIANPIAAPSVPSAALLSFMAWHGVSFDADIALPQGELPFGASLEFSVTFVLMLGLAVTGYLLYRAGRWVSRDAAGGWLAGMRGVQIAVVYAVLVFVLGIIAGVDIQLPDTIPGGGPEAISVQPSLLGAFWMPLLLASLAAGAGALSGKLSPGGRLARLVVSGIAGGWRAAWLAVTLASTGFLIVAALNPEETRAYVDIFHGGFLSRAFVVVSTLLFLPNVGTGIAAGAMGGSINIAALGDSCAVISYLQFPHGLGEPAPGDPCALPFDLGPAPFQYLLFLLVPFLATLAGGWLAAQRMGARRAEDGALAGVTIALPYALWLWVLSLIARVGYAATAGFFPFEIRAWVGPGLVSTVLVALAWGAAGGAIGGVVGTRYAQKANGPGMVPGPAANV